eukprot:2629853-Pyramimonas_sp.AAC.1
MSRRSAKPSGSQSVDWSTSQSVGWSISNRAFSPPNDQAVDRSNGQLLVNRLVSKARAERADG